MVVVAIACGPPRSVIHTAETPHSEGDGWLRKPCFSRHDMAGLVLSGVPSRCDCASECRLRLSRHMHLSVDGYIAWRGKADGRRRALAAVAVEAGRCAAGGRGPIFAYLPSAAGGVPGSA